jgi:hypothetical protein
MNYTTHASQSTLLLVEVAHEMVWSLLVDTECTCAHRNRYRTASAHLCIKDLVGHAIRSSFGLDEDRLAVLETCSCDRPTRASFLSIFYSVDGSAALEGIIDERMSCEATSETAAMSTLLCRSKATTPKSFLILSRYLVWKSMK